VTVAVCDSVPLVPVTVTTTVPTLENVQDRMEVPDPVTVVGFNEQAVLSEERLTSPVKLLRAPIVIVEVPATPVSTDIDVGFAAIEKSGAGAVTVMVNVALFLTRVPDVARLVA